MTMRGTKRTTILNAVYPDEVVDLAIRFKIRSDISWDVFTYMEIVMQEEDYDSAVQLEQDALRTLQVNGSPCDEFFTEMAKLFLAV